VAQITPAIRAMKPVPVTRCNLITHFTGSCEAIFYFVADGDIWRMPPIA
jgi:hypothetical protein